MQIIRSVLLNLKEPSYTPTGKTPAESRCPHDRATGGPSSRDRAKAAAGAGATARLERLDGRCTPEDFAEALGCKPEHGLWYMRMFGLRPYRGHPEGAFEAQEIRRMLAGERVKPHPRRARNPRPGVWYACELSYLRTNRDRPFRDLAKFLGRNVPAVASVMARRGYLDEVPEGWEMVCDLGKSAAELRKEGWRVRRFFGVPHALPPVHGQALRRAG